MSKQEQVEKFKDARWWQLIDKAVEEGQPLAEVARKMGVSRVYVTRVRSGSIAKPPEKFVARVLAAFDVVNCPHLKEPLAPNVCAKHATASYASLSSPQQVMHWSACQKCAHHPKTGSDNLMHGPQAVRPVVVTKLDRVLHARAQQKAAA